VISVAPDAESTVEQRVHAELRLIRRDVTGVFGSLVATSDGFLVSHDVPGLEPAELAALVATTRAVATATMAAAGRGHFREAVTRGGNGYVAVYAAGPFAILAVLGSGELNVGMLQFQTRDIVQRIAAYSAQFATWSGGDARAVWPGAAPRPAAGTGAAGLPRRRPAGP
jgi:uncharacterized protein